ncbi:hypothetical protein SAMN05192533_105103 [Mesobacillus persicus]|uniref:Uncharacterized protein n=1 Tax=Mesobacillus persicus TaxID=930146 RepID=A0A1H8APE8_9BACI|nr:hypothetical protein SAMN05192533_105103 [Mesobacillus persicus]
MDKEKLKVVNRLQMIALVLTVVFSFIPAIGAIYIDPNAWIGVNGDLLSVIFIFFISYYSCKIVLKLWGSVAKRL